MRLICGGGKRRESREYLNASEDNGMGFFLTISSRKRQDSCEFLMPSTGGIGGRSLPVPST